MLEPVLEQGKELELEMELVLVPVPVLEQGKELELVPVLALVPHKQSSLRLTITPMESIILSFSSVKIPPFRFWSTKDYSTTESYHLLFN